jgi:serine/threonine-protein kinase
VRPFAAVSVDGRYVGDTPLPPIQLTEGPHTLKLVNAELGQTHEVELHVSGEQVYRYSFRP